MPRLEKVYLKNNVMGLISNVSTGCLQAKPPWGLFLFLEVANGSEAKGLVLV